MAHATTPRRRTTADELFENLRNSIVRFELPPGTKLSESDVASKSNVSRQPVREAFIRLHHHDLVEVRPQRATIVRPISRAAITEARFVHLSVELETGKRAMRRYNTTHHQHLLEILQKQNSALNAGETAEFLSQDHAFHLAIFSIADCANATSIIGNCEDKVSRLRQLAHNANESISLEYQDHVNIVNSLENQNISDLEKSIRDHMTRLDDTINSVQNSHADYFCD